MIDINHNKAFNINRKIFKLEEEGLKITPTPCQFRAFSIMFGKDNFNPEIFKLTQKSADLIDKENTILYYIDNVHSSGAVFSDYLLIHNEKAYKLRYFINKDFSRSFTFCHEITFLNDIEEKDRALALSLLKDGILLEGERSLMEYKQLPIPKNPLPSLFDYTKDQLNLSPKEGTDLYISLHSQDFLKGFYFWVFLVNDRKTGERFKINVLLDDKKNFLDCHLMPGKKIYKNC